MNSKLSLPQSEVFQKPFAQKIKVLIAYFQKAGFFQTVKKIKNILLDYFGHETKFIIKNDGELSNVKDSYCIFEFDGSYVYMSFPDLVHQNQIDNKVYNILREVFDDQIYKKLKGDCILDIGGYFGETGIYFGINNPEAKIYIYEPQNICHEYITKNCQGDQFEIYNLAVLGDNIKRPIIQIANNGLCSSKIEEYNSKSGSSELSYTPTISIYNIINTVNPDCIKIDIEGGEYDICEQFLSNSLLLKNIKNGMIEFHNLGNTSNLYIFLELGKLLNKLGYKVKYSDNFGKIITITDSIIKYGFANMYFAK